MRKELAVGEGRKSEGEREREYEREKIEVEREILRFRGREGGRKGPCSRCQRCWRYSIKRDSTSSCCAKVLRRAKSINSGKFV